MIRWADCNTTPVLKVGLGLPIGAQRRQSDAQRRADQPAGRHIPRCLCWVTSPRDRHRRATTAPPLPAEIWRTRRERLLDPPESRRLAAQRNVEVGHCTKREAVQSTLNCGYSGTRLSQIPAENFPEFGRRSERRYAGGSQAKLPGAMPRWASRAAMAFKAGRWKWTRCITPTCSNGSIRSCGSADKSMNWRSA